MKVRVLLAAAALAGCSSLGEDELFSADPLPDAAAAIDPTLDAIQSQIFEPLCGCHLVAEPAGALDLRTGFAHAALVDQVSSCDADYTRVVPGDPAGSFLVVKLAAFTDGAPLDCGTRMPESDTPLSSVQLDAIEQWIADGAPDAESP